MDTSKEYIEMCEKSLKDIKWKPAVGDYIFRKYTVFGEPLDSQIWRDKDAFEEVVILHYLSSVPDYYHGVTLKGKERVVCFKDSAAMVKATSVPLWRQDQLQEMVGDYPNNYLDFVNWNETYYPITVFPLQKQQMHPFSHFNSMEQLWLAYVVWRKFHKVWNGEDWEKS